jgi:hypothetical protein
MSNRLLRPNDRDAGHARALVGGLLIEAIGQLHYLVRAGRAERPHAELRFEDVSDEQAIFIIGAWAPGGEHIEVGRKIPGIGLTSCMAGYDVQYVREMVTELERGLHRALVVAGAPLNVTPRPLLGPGEPG